MTDQHDPIETNTLPWAEPIPVEIPLARPAALDYGTAFMHRPHDLLLPDSTRKAAWADIGMAIVLLLAFVIYSETALVFATGAVDLPPEVSDTATTSVVLVPALILRAAGIIAIIALILAHRRQNVRSIGVTGQGMAVNLLLGGAACIVCYGVAMLWGIVSLIFWPELAAQMEENAERLQEMIPRQSPAGFMWLALLIGVYEELFFRGFLMTRLRRATGGWGLAVALSTVMFVGLHAFDQEPAVLAPIAALSLVFSGVTIWRRSLVPAVVGHCLWDLSQFLFMYQWAGESWK